MTEIENTLSLAREAAFSQSPDREYSRYYVSVSAKFAIAVAVATAWFALSTWLSVPWIDDLWKTFGAIPAWLVVLSIALIPGWLNAFLVVSLVLDRPPRLRLNACDVPPVTILVAAYNEEKRIARTLQSIRQLDYPAPVSVIVVDDGSSDRTAEIVEQVATEHSGVFLIRAPHGGKARALNAGLTEVLTKHVVTIDADTWMHPQSLKRLMTRFVTDPAHTAAVAGCVLAHNSRETLLTRMQEWDYFLAIASVKRQQSLYQGTLVAQGAFSAYLTEAVRDAEAWPDVIGEDIVLTWALIRSGYRIGFEATAIGFTDVPSRLPSFARQRKRWARGMIEGLRTHGDVIVKRRSLVTFLMGLDVLFPLLDLSFTLLFLPGIVAAFLGRFLIVGPMTLAVLPLTLLISLVMYGRQRAVFDELGLRPRKNRFGYVLYLLVYQIIMSPICVVGYAEELFGAQRRW